MHEYFFNFAWLDNDSTYGQRNGVSLIQRIRFRSFHLACRHAAQRRSEKRLDEVLRMSTVPAGRDRTRGTFQEGSRNLGDPLRFLRLLHPTSEQFEESYQDTPWEGNFSDLAEMCQMRGTMRRKKLTSLLLNSIKLKRITDLLKQQT